MAINKIGESAIPVVPLKGQTAQQGKKTASSGTSAAKAPGNNVQTSFVGNAMNDFKKSLLDTISSGVGQSGGIYTLVGTPVDKFITKSFTQLPKSDKQQFMKLFTDLTTRSPGLVPQDMIQQTFGGQGGFGDLMAQIGTKLNSRLK